MIISRENQSPFSGPLDKVQQARSFQAAHPSLPPWIPVRWFILHYSRQNRHLKGKEERRLCRRVDKDSHSLFLPPPLPLLLLHCMRPPLHGGLPLKAKTNISAKQGSIRPGSTVTLASHLPGRGPNEPGGLPRSEPDLICITTASLSLGLVLPRCCNVSCLVLPVREVCISLMRTCSRTNSQQKSGRRERGRGFCVCVHTPRRKCILILNRIIQ